MESTVLHNFAKAIEAKEARERAQAYKEKLMPNRKRKLDDIDIGKSVSSAISRGDAAFVVNFVRRWDVDELNSLDNSNRTILHKATQELARYSQNQWGLARNLDEDDYDTELNDRMCIVVWLANFVYGTIKADSGHLAVHALLKSRDKRLQHALNVLLAKEGVLELCCQDGDLLLDAVYWGRWEIVRGVIDKQDAITQKQWKKMVMRTFFTDNCLDYHGCIAPDDMSFLHDIINEPNDSGYTPLMLATLQERSELVIKLVKNGANMASAVDLRKHEHLSRFVVRDPDRNEGTLSAIVLALKQLHRIELTSEAYRALINESIVHITDKHLNTPLHLAIRSGRREIVEMLIEAGTDLTKKNISDRIPLQLGIACPDILHNPEAICKLIPKNDMIDFNAVVQYVDALNETAEIDSRESIPEVLSRLLLCTKRDDFFSMCRVNAVGPLRLNDENLVYELTRRNTNGEEVPWIHIKHSNMYAISYLVRKGLNGTTSPGCSAVLKAYRAQGGLYGPNDGKMDARFEKAAKEAEEIDSLFDGPLTAFELSSFAIRDSIPESKYEMLSQLPKPKLIVDHLLFLELGKKICELLHYRPRLIDLYPYAAFHN